MAPKYVLNYFDGTGRAEAARLMFHAAGVVFDDNRMSREEWIKNKPDTTRFPMHQMPTLQVDDKTICQSNAIFRFLASELGFYGDSICERVMIDQIVETFNEMITAVIPIFFGGHDDETKKTKFAEYFASEQLKKQLVFISNILKNNNGGSGWFVGNEMSLADIMLYCTGLFLEGPNPDYVKKFPHPDYLKDFPELKSLQERVVSVEKIKKYLNSQKK